MVIIPNVGDTVWGAVVDAVVLQPEAIKPAPRFHGQVDGSFVCAIATVGAAC